MSFTHLTLSSEYSLVKGTTCIDSLFKHCAARDIEAIALTDVMNMFATVKFYNASLKNNVKPLFGCEVLVSSHNKIYSMTLIAQNMEGYKSISKAISLAYQRKERHNSLPIIPRPFLSYINNVFVLCGGMRGELGEALLYDMPSKAEEILEFYLNIFKDNFIIDIHRLGLPWENVYLRRCLELANRKSVPIVISNQVCFLNKEDHLAHEIRVAIHDGVCYDPKNKSLYSEEQYLKSAAEMIELFKDMPNILDNTNYIAAKCDVAFPRRTPVFPLFNLSDVSEEKYLTQAALEGLNKKIQDVSQTYRLRLEEEIAILKRTGFISYFLIVADFVGWAKKQSIPVGPGRGSGAGSLVAYALNITDIDPVLHGLLFERFLNPERTTIPDFDIDFCIEGRDRVIDYVKQKYGSDKVAQIIAYSTLSARAVIRDVGRCLGRPYRFVSKIVELVPKTLGITLEQATIPGSPLEKLCQQEVEVADIIAMAKKLEGVKRGVTRHAAGVVIAPTTITDYVPLFCEADNSHVVTQFDKADIESMGLIKFDFLGLRTLTIINKTINKIKEVTSKEICLSSIPLDDVKTFMFLQTGSTAGIFQLESPGMQKLIKRINLQAFRDIVDLISLYRPGPLGLGMVEEYVQRKNSKKPIQYLHQSLEEILRETYGIIVYQEQIMKIAQRLAGFSLAKADLLQRAIGKKQGREMEALKEEFMQGAAANGIPLATTANIFDLIAEFAKYGFNKSHACSYSTITYQTGYLKAHYSTIFMSILLSADMSSRDKTLKYLQEVRRMGIRILPPDINHSSFDFTYVDARTIRFGLAAIKGVGAAQLDPILKSRIQGGSFKDIYDLFLRSNLQKIHLSFCEKLIYAGALDSFGMSRTELLAHLPLALQEAKNQNELSRQITLLPTDQTVTRRIPKIYHVTNKYILQKEIEMLGIALSGHLIHTDVYWLKKLQVRSCTDLTIAESYIFAGEITARYVMQKGVILVLNEAGATFECNLRYQDYLLVIQYCFIHSNILVKSSRPAYYRKHSNRYYVQADSLVAIEEAVNEQFRNVYFTLKAEDLAEFLILYDRIVDEATTSKKKYQSINVHLEIMGQCTKKRLQKTTSCSLYNMVNLVSLLAQDFQVNS